MLGQEFAEEDALLGQALGERVVREQVDEFVAECRKAGGLEADERRARLDLVLQHRQGAAATALGRVEPAPVVERPAAAQRAAVGIVDLEARRLEHPRGRNGRLGPEVVVERVGPQQDAPAAPARRRAPANQCRECLVRERAACVRSGAMPPTALATSRDQRRPRDAVREPRQRARPSRATSVDPPHRVGARGAAAARRSGGRGTPPCRSPCRR